MKTNKLFHVLVLGGALAAGCGGQSTAAETKPAPKPVVEAPAEPEVENKVAEEPTPKPEPKTEAAAGVRCW